MRFLRENAWRLGAFAAIAAILPLLWQATCQPGQAAEPTAGAMSEAARWAAAKFGGVAESPPEPLPGLVVLANNDPVQRNARGGRPMRIVNAEFTRGLYCHAFSKIIVRLPGPGDAFTAVAGVDSNEQTGGGRGSVRFAVLVGGAEAFQSAVLREGMAGVPVNVKLDGAREFVLQVDDAGDGIGCDQADWADAKVKLQDGREVWLADLPLREGAGRPPFTTEPPFSFKYDGKTLAELAWQPARSTRKLDAERTEHTLRYADEPTGLEVRCVAVEYHDFPIVEWTVYFKNTGTGDTPILADILALDARFHRTGGGEFVLHHNLGSPCTPNDFQPLETALKPGGSKRITAAGGRPSNSDWPYFNVAWPGAGVIVAVGWPGQWAADFTADATNGLRIRAGQERTHFKLQPGEEVRTPLMVVQFWEGDWIAAQNVWRRWMLAHNLPRPGGQLPPVQMAACSSHQFGEMIHADSASQKLFVDRYLEEQLPLDYWWMDAGWYLCDGQWPKTGTWEVDTKRFPGGLRPISDHARAKGVKTIVWFEPERVHSGTWLTENHPEWILGGKNGGLLNLGNPEARQWLTEHVDKLLTEQGIDLYRQDFNMDPLSFWRTERRRGSPGHHREPPCHRLSGLLGRTAPPASQHADRLLRLGRPPQRSGNDAPGRAAAAERLHHGAGRQPGPHLRPLALAAVPRHGDRFARHLAVPPPQHAGHAFHGVFRRAPQRPGLRHDPPRAGTVEAVCPVLFRRLLPADRRTAWTRPPGWPGSSTCRKRARAWSRPSAARRASMKSPASNCAGSIPAPATCLRIWIPASRRRSPGASCWTRDWPCRSPTSRAPR